MSILWAILSAIVTGLIIGALARLVVPGTKGVSIVMTIVLGIAGAIVGSLVYGLFGGKDTSGVDWIRLIVEVVVAAIFVWIYVGVSGRKSRLDRVGTGQASTLAVAVGPAVGADHTACGLPNPARLQELLKGHPCGAPLQQWRWRWDLNPR